MVQTQVTERGGMLSRPYSFLPNGSNPEGPRKHATHLLPKLYGVWTTDDEPSLGRFIRLL
jgi:hypothetical protein